MIISFSVENWMSFRNKASFSMIASQERQHRQRLPRIKKYTASVLPVSAFYGGNASGKTNLFTAMSFAKTLVVKGTQPETIIPVEPFRLDSSCAKKPSRFSFELLINDTIYEFSFAVTRKAVVEEKLVKVLSKNERILYDRRNDKINFDKSLRKNERLDFVFKGTRENQLFLTNSISQNIKIFKPIYDWFNNTLELVGPETRFESIEAFFQEEHPFSATMNNILTELDTGIVHLGGEEIPFANIPINDSDKSEISDAVKEDTVVQIMLHPDIFLVTRQKGELTAKKLVTYHNKTDGTEAKFEMRDESDGSRRIIDLLPAFLDVSAPKSARVYVIDEIDRSLHTLLIRQLLESYLASCSPETRSQLLFTTHDVLLMDQKLLRRDEMWVTERNLEGESSVFSFSEYKDIRYDKDIRKSYLQGRLGGVPRILFSGALKDRG